LPDGIGSALVPVVVAGSLLGGEDFDERARILIETIGALDVAMERGAVELCQHVDARKPELMQFEIGYRPAGIYRREAPPASSAPW